MHTGGRLVTDSHNRNEFVLINADENGRLAGTLTLSGLMLGCTSIGTEGAAQLAESLLKGTEELVKLDLSYCGLTSNYVLNISVNLSCSILELNLEGNPIMPEVMTCRPRSDLYVNLPALRKLDNMLLEILDSFVNT